MTDGLLAREFDAALVSRVGVPVRLDAALLAIAPHLQTARNDGCSWVRLASELSEVLALHDRKSISTDTLRGMVRRHSRSATLPNRSDQDAGERLHVSDPSSAATPVPVPVPAAPGPPPRAPPMASSGIAARRRQIAEIGRN